MYLYNSLGADAPQLDNTWGCFNKLINYIIDGGTTFSVTKIEPYKDKKLRIYYDKGSLSRCPWSLSTTVTVSGSSNYSGDYFIESIDDINNCIIGYNSNIVFEGSQIESYAGISIKTKASGIKRIFGGVDDERTVIQFTDGVQYRIDDRDPGPLVTPVVKWNDKWWKFARVSFSEYYDSLDSTPNRLYPYNPSRPFENIQPIGPFAGDSFFQYNIANENEYYITQTSYNKTINHYQIFANEYAMYIQIFIGNMNSKYSRFYVMGSIKNSTDENGILVSQNYSGAEYTYYNSIGSSYIYSEQCTSFLSVNAPNRSNTLLYNNYIKTSAITPYFCGEYGPGSRIPSGRYGVSYPNSKGEVIFSDVLVFDDVVYGKLHDIKFINTRITSDIDGYYIIDDELYMTVRQNFNNSNYDTAYMIKLTRS